MKTLMLLVVTCFLASTASAEDNGRPATQAEAAPSPRPLPLGVEEFMKHVDRHRGEVRVEGVVSAASAKDRKLALIDVKEFKECGVVTCAEYTLPVRWTAEMPALKDRVIVEGKVEELEGKLVFVARLLSRVEPPRGEKR